MAYTKAEWKQEEEANYFANCLLMPREMFVEEFLKHKSILEEDRVKILAKAFDVPDWAVINRIRELKNDLR